MGTRGEHSTRSTILRIALALTAISLLFYVPYRYVTRAPEFGGFLGTGYALLFPLSALLAAAALWAAWRPRVIGDLDGSGGGRWVLGGYGGAWVLMGLMCLPSLTSLAAHSPVQGLFSSIHMTAQHVFLGFSAVAVAVDPAVARAVLEGRSPRDAWRGETSTAEPETSRVSG